MKKKLAVLLGLALSAATGQTKAQSWNLTGNAGTTPSTDFIGTTDFTKLKFKTDNKLRMVIMPNGNIGIGTNAPVSKLHVNATITDKWGNTQQYAEAYSWGNHALAGYLTSESDPQVGSNTNNYVSRWNGSALVTSNVYSTGNFVGINATSAIGQSQLVVQGNSSSYSGMFVNNAGAAGSRKPFYGYAVGGANPCWTYYDEASSSWRVYNTADHLTVESNGQVGIGTTTPGADLHIANNSNTFAFRIDQGVNGSGQLTYVNTTSNAVTVFSASSNTTGMYIKGDGKVSIGSTTASSRLTVAGRSTSSLEPNVEVYETAAAANTDVRGIKSTCIMNPGYGYGIEAIGGYQGVYGLANATSYTGFAYGVYGSATGTAGTRIGVYGTASGGTIQNWGGYFPTKVYATELRVGSTLGATGYKLCVDGKAICEEVRVELSGNWPDYVFDTDHELMSLSDLKDYVGRNRHLPGMPSACDIETNGHHLGEIQTRLVEKTEENTLYILQLKAEIESLRAELAQMRKQ